VFTKAKEHMIFEFIFNIQEEIVACNVGRAYWKLYPTSYVVVVGY